MGTTYTHIEEGARLDITVEFITRRAVECEDGRMHRLVVSDEADTQFTVLATPDSDRPVDLKTGGEYRLSGLLGATPVTSQATGEECPACGGPVRPRQAVDIVDSNVAAVTAELELDEPFGILDAQASMRGTEGDETVVDDWVPMQEKQPAERPEYVCESCGRHLSVHELEEQRIGAVEMTANMAPPASGGAASAETVGLSAGGAKDIGNFRENVENGYTPQPEAVSDEGLFYDYYFETGERGDTDALFAPRYGAAVSDHPITSDTEQYLSVGLDSTLSVEEFERPRLDLVAVLDVSGSMDSQFDEYYYDEHGRQQSVDTDGETKLEAATEALCALTEQLHAEDRLGVVLYNHRAHVAKPLRDVGATDMPAIRRHIREIAAGGSTNLADGFEAAVDMLIEEMPDPRVERRVVFMTDMMPNTGTTDDGALTELFADAATDGIHTTFVGMGLDANADLAEALSGIRGANHYFVHSGAEFERRLGDEFDYMVSPLVYDLTLELDGDGHEVVAVHGSPSADPQTGCLLHVGTLFPSAKEDGEARGGVVLVRLADAADDLELVASWTERGGGEHVERVRVDLPAAPETYAHDGVQKAVALSRYARELRAWAGTVHDRAETATGVDDWLLPDQRGEHERESVPLVVPESHADRLATMRAYLDGEMDAVGDEALKQELALLGTLCEQAEIVSLEVTE
jgi:Ca-activated chloride channel family protein